MDVKHDKIFTHAKIWSDDVIFIKKFLIVSIKTLKIRIRIKFATK